MKKRKTVSFSFVNRVSLTFILAVVLSLFIFVERIADHSLRNQSAEVNQQILSFSMQELDRQMSDVDHYLYKYISESQDVQLLQIEADETNRYFAKQTVSRSLWQAISLYPVIDGALFYFPDGSGKVYLNSSGRITNLSESENIRNRVTHIVDRSNESDGLNNSDWFLEEIDGQKYLFRLIKFGNSYCGAWINTIHLMDSVPDTDFGESSLTFFATNEGRVISSIETLPDFIDLESVNWKHPESGKDFMQINTKSTMGAFSLVTAIPVETVTKELSAIKRLVFILPIIFIALVFFYWQIYGQLAIKPFKRLILMMTKAGAGNLDVKIDKPTRITEFKTANSIFNNMVSDIKNLKIDIYEQQINEQQIKRQYLQTQINSHFFLNCINIIYALAQIQNYQLIQEMSMYLVNYFRYIANSADRLVPLKDELNHVRNYLKIQEMRFPDRFSVDIQLDAGLDRFPVLPLIVQTFVENTMKYAMNDDDITHIVISIRDVGDGVSIMISDNGPGFDDGLLLLLNDPNVSPDLNKIQGIGINNIKNRLQLFYGEKASVTFKNAEEAGAVVIIWLPKEGNKDAGYFISG